MYINFQNFSGKIKKRKNVELIKFGVGEELKGLNCVMKKQR